MIHLKIDKAFIKVFSKYIDFGNIFSSKLAIKFPKYTGSNNNNIKLVDY